MRLLGTCASRKIALFSFVCAKRLNIPVFKAVHFDDNYQVRRGDLLVDLDPRDFEVNRAIAAASLASARSKVVEAQAQQKTTRPAASPTSFETRVEVLA